MNPLSIFELNCRHRPTQKSVSFQNVGLCKCSSNYFDVNQIISKVIAIEINETVNFQVLNEKQHEMAGKNEYNFDHPDAFDFELLIPTLQRLKKGKKVDVPIYNFITHGRESRTVSRNSCADLFYSSWNIDKNISLLYSR